MRLPRSVRRGASLGEPSPRRAGTSPPLTHFGLHEEQRPSIMARVSSAPGKAASTGRAPPFRPMQLATLVDTVPTGNRWLHEMKYDGYRVLLSVGGGEAVAYTRSGLDWSEKFSGLVVDALKLKVSSALIDGEDLTPLPLTERKAKLAKIRPKGKSRLRYSDHIAGNGEKLLNQFCAAGLEGVISKRADGRYVGSRSGGWLKTKCIKRQEFVVVGWTPSDKSRLFRSLILGVHEDGVLAPVHYSATDSR